MGDEVMTMAKPMCECSADFIVTTREDPSGLCQIVLECADCGEVFEIPEKPVLPPSAVAGLMIRATCGDAR